MLANVNGCCSTSGSMRIRLNVAVSGGIPEASDWRLVSCSRDTPPSNHSSTALVQRLNLSVDIMKQLNMLESLSHHSSSLGIYSVRRHMF